MLTLHSIRDFFHSPLGYIYLAIIFVFLCATVLFLCFSKTKNPFKLGILIAVIHFFLVISLAVYVYLAGSTTVDWGMIVIVSWLIFFFLDPPSSLFLFPFFYSLPRGSTFFWTGIYIPVVFFGLLGSYQYFLIGLGIGHLYTKLTQK